MADHSYRIVADRDQYLSINLSADPTWQNAHLGFFQEHGSTIVHLKREALAQLHEVLGQALTRYAEHDARQLTLTEKEAA